MRLPTLTKTRALGLAGAFILGGSTALGAKQYLAAGILALSGGVIGAAALLLALPQEPRGRR